MATDQQTVRLGTETRNRAIAQDAGAMVVSAESSLAEAHAEIPTARMSTEQGALIKGIPIEIDVAIPIRQFQVRNVLALAVGQVIATRWVDGDDVPLAAPGAQLAWTEIEVIDQKLAVRITRLA